MASREDGDLVYTSPNMIIRALSLRHGRIALPRTLLCNGRRYFTPSPSSQCPEQQVQTTSYPHYLPSEIRDPNHPVAQEWAFIQHKKATTKHVGSSLEPHYRPHELVSNPPGPQDVTLELLMASQAHIGHATSLWHPANAKYIFGVRGRHDPIHIISLDVTAAYLRRACKIVRGVASKGGLILFVGTREGQAQAVVRAARFSKGCHLFTKWIPGSITNGQQILGACGKKVVDENDNSIPGFGDQLPNTAALKPDLVICLNPLENYTLLHECGIHNIPTIGIVDTDVNPTWVTYPIPANDDSQRCVQVICGVLGRAGEEGQKIRLANARRGVVVSMPSHGLEEPTEGQAERDLEAEERAKLADAAVQEELLIEAEAAAMEDARKAAIRDAQAAARAELEAAANYASLEDSRSADAAVAERAFRREQELDEEWDDEETDVPYERDRPLTQEELGEAFSTSDEGFSEVEGAENGAEDKKA